MSQPKCMFVNSQGELDKAIAQLKINNPPVMLQEIIPYQELFTISQNRLAASSVLDMEYLAYLDITGKDIGQLPPQKEGVVWFGLFPYLASNFLLLKKEEFNIGRFLRPLVTKKTHAVADPGDPLPFIFYIRNLFIRSLKLFGLK